MNVTNGGPLSDIRVLELSRNVAAAYCGRQFAAWGADVVVAEPPERSPLRRLHPFATGADGRPVSLLWTNVAANKRAVRVETRDGLAELLAAADVLITDYDEAALAAHGICLADLAETHPALCAISITPFGLAGPYAGFCATELIVQALSGYLGLNGLMGEPPLQAPGHITGYAVGVNAFVGALAAYLKRERTGHGDLVEVSGMESLASIIPFLRVQYLGSEKRREGGTEAGVRILPCADGWISMMVVNPLHKPMLAEVLHIPDAAFPEDLYEGAYADIVRKTVDFYSAYTRERSADELFFAIEHCGVTCGKVMSPKNLLDLEQLKVRGFFREAQHPQLGPVRFAGPAARLGRVDQVAPAAAPDDAMTAGAAALGWTPRPPREAAPERRSELPLKGVRVLDLTQAWIGPFATLIFADLGADVIKIESHKRPDVWRQASPQPVAITNIRAERVNRSHYFNSVNRNKRDLTLDLRSPEGKEIFLRLVRDADAVAENYTARVMSKFGLDYAALSAVKPDLVMMSSSGFGKSGPWLDFKTNGSAIEALAGWDWLHRYPGGAPILMGFYQADAIDGLQMAALTLICLVRKMKTGEGDHIDGAMLEASASYLGEIFLQTQLTGEPQAAGNRSPDMAPHGVFRCAGDDRWIAIAAADDAAWDALARAAGIADRRFATIEGRQRHEDLLDAKVAAWTRTREADVLMQALQAVGVPAGVVRSAVEGLDEPHLAARDWFKTMTHPDLGAHKYNGFPWRFSACELKATIPPPRLGEHSDELLKELLSFSEAEIAELKAKDVTGQVF
jgi:crotonobetainyl-CoA:carnitine CoA-transferase CaiB-like acyl-CoA transferase